MSVPDVATFQDVAAPGSAPTAPPPLEKPSGSAYVEPMSGQSAAAVAAAAAVVADPALFASTPSTIGAKLAGVLSLRVRAQTAESMELEGENPATGVRRARVGFGSERANGKWRFMDLTISYSQSRPSELNYDAFLKELSRRLGRPKFHKNKLAIWNRGRDQEISLSAHNDPPVVADGGWEPVVSVAAGVPQGEAE